VDDAGLVEYADTARDLRAIAQRLHGGQRFTGKPFGEAAEVRIGHHEVGPAVG
jgi:hypothetical protein